MENKTDVIEENSHGEIGEFWDERFIREQKSEYRNKVAKLEKIAGIAIDKAKKALTEAISESDYDSFHEMMGRNHETIQKYALRNYLEGEDVLSKFYKEFNEVYKNFNEKKWSFE